MSEDWIAVAPDGAVGRRYRGADQKIDQVRSRDASQLGHVDVRDAGDIAPVAEDESRFPLEMIAVGLIGVASRVLNWPFAHVAMLEASHLAFGEGTMEGVVAPDRNPDRRVGEEVPPPSRTFAAVAEFDVFFVE